MSDDVPECKSLKPLLSGSIPVDQFVQTLEKVRSPRWQVGFQQIPAHLRCAALVAERGEMILV